MRKFILGLSVAFWLWLALVNPAVSRDLLIGLTGRDLTPPYAQAMRFGVERQAQVKGVKIVARDSQNDVQKQLTQMDDLLQQGVSGLIFHGTNDSAAVISGIKKFNAKNIPIVALDNVPDGGRVDYWVAFDVVDASKKAAEYFLKALKEKNGGSVPWGVIIEVTGDPKDGFTKECSQGFHEVMDPYKRQLKVFQADGQWNQKIARSRTAELLAAHEGMERRVRGIFVHTPDLMGAGVVQAIEEADRNPADYFISGICLSPEARDLVQAGKVYCVVAQPALDAGELGFKYLADLMAGAKDLPREGDIINKEGALWAPAQVVRNPRCDGLMIKLNAPAVPFEVEVDDPRLWENVIGK